MKVLIIEDHKSIADNLKKGLNKKGINVDVAYDGLYGYDLASNEHYDVIVLDLMLPELSGEDICKKLRQKNINTPILVLTAKSDVLDKVKVLDMGADDYMTKPFVFIEFLARLKALSRRKQTQFIKVLKYQDLSLDISSMIAKRGQKQLDLSKKGLALFEYFLKNPKKIISKQEILTNVWEFESDITINAVETQISRLRKSINTGFRKKYIFTIRGLGYLLDKDDK